MRCKAKGNHIITSAIEHHAILHTCQQLEREGFKVTYLPVDEYGQVSAADVEKAITPETTLISIMTANNEIGTIQPIAEIGAIARAHGVRFHTDAVQAVGAIPVDVKAMNVDLLSLSGHKLHAPKGVGALYIRSGVRLERLMNGGAQERTQRPGTENMPSIVGLGRAIELATANIWTQKAAYVSALRDRLINGILRDDSRHPPERPSPPTACPATATCPSAISRANRCCSIWTSRALPRRPARPARPGSLDPEPCAAGHRPHARGGARLAALLAQRGQHRWKRLTM